MKRHIMIIAGEVSGDRHGANLIDNLKIKDPDIRFTGLGGPLMRKAGQEQLYDIRDLSVLGLTEVIKKIFFFRRVLNETFAFVKRERPDVLVLIDYPGFNVRLAEQVHGLQDHTKIIYYISPQVWAWGKNRVKRIGKVIDKMLIVFPFEKEIYEKENVPVSFVGHPLQDELKDISSKDEARRELGLNPQDLVIGILPGSRLQEIKLILPVMLETALLLKKRFKPHFLIPLAHTIKLEAIEKEIKKFFPHEELDAGFLKIIKDNSSRLIKASDLIITASGTATLETAILERPMVIIYKVPFLSYLVLRHLIKVPYIGMVNILLKERACPEFIQYKARSYEIFKACCRILEDTSFREKMLENLKKVKNLLGEQGAGLRASEEIWKITYGETPV